MRGLVPKQKVDHLNIARFVEFFQRFLLTNYDYVIHSDCDELLVHQDNFNFIEQLGKSVHPIIFKPKYGANIIQHQMEELDTIVTDIPITLQRKYYYCSEDQRKPAISNCPITWMIGFHTQFNKTAEIINERLWLIHLNQVSIQECQKKYTNWACLEFSDFDKSYVYIAKNKNASNSATDIQLAKTDALSFFNYHSKYEINVLPEWIIGRF